MALLRTIVWFFYFFGKLILLIPRMKKAQRLKDAKDNSYRDIVDASVKQWANTLLHLAGVTVSVHGLENLPKDRAVVITPNHQSDYDIPLMLTRMGAAPALVAKIETKKIPLVRTWMRLLDCVFLDRKNPRQAVAALSDAAEVLRGGRSVVVFPEGTRSKCDTMGEFKSGAFKMAFKAGAPIVPVAIDGSYRIMEANHHLMCPGHIEMTVLAPIETADMDRAAQHALPQLVQQRIAQYLPPQQPHGAEAEKEG